MKKKIAICGNGWNNEYIETVMAGFRRCAKENNADLFWLCNYSDDNMEEFKQIGDVNIDRLLEYGQFDGVILLANTFHLQQEFEYLQEVVHRINLPVVSMEYRLPGIDFWGSDNYSGMSELARHLVEHHGVKEVVYVSGPKGNEESDSRRKALEDVLVENGLSLKAENIVYGNWNYHEVLVDLPKWIQGHEYLPDAVVCANDVMAMATCAVLESLNISVPEQVKVTGFDHLLTARNFYPSIASVDRNWEDMGYRSMQYLLGKIDGEKGVAQSYVLSSAMPGESCGCNLPEAVQLHRDIRKRGIYANFVTTSFWEGHLCDIGDSLSMIVDDREFHTRFTEFFEKAHNFEGDEFYFCLVDNFFSSLKGGEALTNTGYTEVMDLICGFKDGKPLERQSFDIRSLIPGYDKEAPGGKVYVFLPMYSAEGCYGYVAFGEDIPMMYDYSAYNWNRNIVQNFNRVRQNMVLVQLNNRLEKASVTDALTGVYNRSGCEKIAYPFLEKCHEEGKKAILMFADVNRMKMINDKYGHIQGDVALQTVAKSIREILSEEWIIVRYGGDEFLMVGECTESMHPESILAAISERLEENTQKLQLPYLLKAGVGYVLIEADEKLNLSECLKKADDAMYQMKKRQHAEMNEF